MPDRSSNHLGMAILRERKVWRRTPDRRVDLEALARRSDERANVRRALFALRIEYGSWARGARALGMPGDTLTKMMRRGGASMEAAVLLARLRAVSVEDVLSGAALRRGVCPMCGRT